MHKRSFDIENILKYAFIKQKFAEVIKIMASNKYTFKSHALFDKYTEGEIGYDEYKEELAKIVEEELVGKPNRSSEEDSIYLYESVYHRLPKERIQALNEFRRKKNLLVQERYYEYDIPELIEKYRKESSSYRNTHNFFQWVIIIGSVIVTSTTGATLVTDLFGLSLWFKWTAAILSILVSISAGATGYDKFRERSANLQEAADDIEQEYKALTLKIGIYREAWGKSKEEALSIFAERVENRVTEQKKRQQLLEQPPDAKQGQIQIQR